MAPDPNCRSYAATALLDACVLPRSLCLLVTPPAVRTELRVAGDAGRLLDRLLLRLDPDACRWLRECPCKPDRAFCGWGVRERWRLLPPLDRDDPEDRDPWLRTPLRVRLDVRELLWPCRLLLWLLSWRCGVPDEWPA